MQRRAHLASGLRIEVVNDELLVLDSGAAVVHRLSGRARDLVEKALTTGPMRVDDSDDVVVALTDAGVLVLEGAPIPRRVMLGLAASLGIATLALPDSAAAASGGPGTTSPPVDGSGVSTTTTSTTTTTVAPEVPATITGLTASDISGGSGAGAIRLSFTTPNDNGSPITSYKVYRTVSGSTSLFTTVSASSGPLDITGLTRGTSYTFSVSAVNGAGEAASRSNSVTRTPAALEPDQVTDLVATAGYGSITLSFTAPSDNGAEITSYKVYRTASGVDSLFTTYSGATGPITIDVLDPTVLYTFKVAAVNSVGEAPKSSSDSASPNDVATGGTVTYFTGNGTIGTNGVRYAVHTFVDTDGAAVSDDFVLNVAKNLDYLVVAGGGSGGTAGTDAGVWGCGGGGAGGVRTGSAVSHSVGTYTVSVGARTTAPSRTTPVASNQGNTGKNSSFGTVSASGGGGGGTYNNAGGSGGSGGGGGGRNSTSGGTGNKGSYSPAEGRDGGNARGGTTTGTSGGGGGGGAGSAGLNAASSASTAGAGGSGVQSSITGTNVYYGGGGGGGAYDGSGGTDTAGAGGTGGGGAGSITGNGSTGLNGRGGGGGGSGYQGVGGAGGSGIVVVRYAITKASY